MKYLDSNIELPQLLEYVAKDKEMRNTHKEFVKLVSHLVLEDVKDVLGDLEEVSRKIGAAIFAFDSTAIKEDMEEISEIDLQVSLKVDLVNSGGYTPQEVEMLHSDTLNVLVEIMEKIGLVSKDGDVYSVCQKVKSFVNTLWRNDTIVGADERYGVPRKLIIRDGEVFYTN